MKKILLFGAGKSATVLIRYLLDHASTENWTLTIADITAEPALSKLNGHQSGKAVVADLNDLHARERLVRDADLVISMLPPSFHILIAKDCLEFKKHFLTASYIDEELLLLKEAIAKNNLLFLCETGLDPGIDHMSAMQLLEKIRDAGGVVSGFRSYCGGLIAPEADNNPWHYKISWNPRNIALAGYAGATFRENGQLKNIAYEQVFEHCPLLEVASQGQWASYPNRNSLTYVPVYSLENATTVIRSTLRHPDFCIGWNYIVKAGLSSVSDAGLINSYRGRSIASWFIACLNFYTRSQTFEDFLNRYVSRKEQQLVDLLFRYLGLLGTEPIPEHAVVSADILQYLLETKLALAANDRDMIIMVHEIEYTIRGQQKKSVSTLVVKGDDALHTAMAKTVGLPLGIAARLLLDGSISATGLQIPVTKTFYQPILEELAQNGIRFYETEQGASS
ncbi:saccharopine dehydrogenase C-terminal domain-containing protein [Niabella drilacis]|uniref:Saccharopine dehydrogenase, NADP-dependent n=1 Tax=Niabella drilacis (strain DSM 25811 / CCM 8410 / CCUG 62505 / LMG 26954 / E90) TaxID=1285928 RepID=A0A1G6QUR0_NIADE|nr:saccharopine dehydrogenase C-terminal domain-containing protein [Niabella drilacis]SDC96108.1 Saccharopine dehydrogenase, NADP-dependent [Niabella drilacis]